MTEHPVRLHRARDPRAARGAVALEALPPLALYVHLPWCLKKCPYCDFNSHALRDDVANARDARQIKVSIAPAGPDFDRYIDALIVDLEAALPQVWGRQVSTVFFGGGTPSLFDPAHIDRLLAAIRARLPLEPGAEVTLEANPGTFERERFRGYRAAGITRLSVGVQSFDDAMLAALGRVHDAAQARAALHEALEVFDTFNLDLMYALPGQTTAMLDADLDEAFAFAPPHLSIYHLTIEPNTWFATHPPTLPDDDTAATMLDRLVERASHAGLERYEVSAFARAGHACAHNLNYWRFGDYLGIGAGAHGKLSFPDRIVRQQRWRDPATYVERALAGQAVSNHQEVGAAELPFEFMLNALRLRQGVPLRLFAERTGQSWASVDEAFARGEARGLLERAGGFASPTIRATARGFDFLSDVQALFLRDADAVDDDKKPSQSPNPTP